MKAKYLLPNLFTVSSLTLALFSLDEISQGNYVFACWLLVLSMLFDGMDGKIARLLKASSRLGAELDSLSDFVAFGVVPGFLVYKVCLHRLGILGVVVSVAYVIAGAYRLARFNCKNDDLETKNNFEGLPIPAAAGWIITSIIFNFYVWDKFVTDEILLFIVVLSTYLMVSKIEYVPAFAKSAKGLWPKIINYLLVPGLILSVKYAYVVFFAMLTIYIVVGMLRHMYITLFIANHEIDNEEIIK